MDGNSRFVYMKPYENDVLGVYLKILNRNFSATYLR